MGEGWSKWYVSYWKRLTVILWEEEGIVDEVVVMLLK